AARTATERKLATSAPATASSSERACAGLALAGIDTSPRLPLCATMTERTAGGRSSVSTRVERARAKAASATTPTIATARSAAPRATALFPPDATPTRPSSTAAITVLVSGATVTAIPVPTTTMAGKNVVQYEPPAPGTAQRRNPTAVITGPATSGRRA